MEIKKIKYDGGKFYHEEERGYISMFEISNMGVYKMASFSAQEWAEKGFEEKYTSDFNASGKKKIGSSIEVYQEYASIDELISFLAKKSENELKFNIELYGRGINAYIKVVSEDTTENFSIYLRMDRETKIWEVTDCYDQ